MSTDGLRRRDQRAGGPDRRTARIDVPPGLSRWQEKEFLGVTS